MEQQPRFTYQLDSQVRKREAIGNYVLLALISIFLMLYGLTLAF